MRLSAVLMRAVLMVAAAGLGACASFPMHQVPTVTGMPSLGQPGQRPMARMDVRFYSGEPDNDPTLLTTSQPGVADLVQLVHQTVDESGLFQQVHYDSAEAPPAGPGELHLSLRIYDHCSAAEAVVSSVITGFTLGLVPGGATDNYTLQLEVTDSRGQTLARVSNQDATRTYIGLVFLPFSGHDTKQSLNSVLSNQIRAALKEAYDAGKLVAVNSTSPHDDNSDIPAVAGVK